MVMNKGCGSKFCVGSCVRQETPEGQRIYWQKRCEYNNKDEDNSPKTLNDENTLHYLDCCIHLHFLYHIILT